MGNTCICIAALLVSLTAGMFLLAKTKKDNLGTLYSVIAWFVIAISLGCLLCCSIMRITGNCHEKRCEKEMVMNCGEGDMQQFHKKMRGKHKLMRMEMRGDNCCNNNEECMSNETPGCCMNKGNMKIEECCKKGNVACVKDSVIQK